MSDLTISDVRRCRGERSVGGRLADVGHLEGWAWLARSRGAPARRTIPEGHSGSPSRVPPPGRRAVMPLPPPGARIAGPADIPRQGRLIDTLNRAGLPVPGGVGGSDHRVA